MTQVGSNDREFCGDGLELQKDRRSGWVLVVYIKEMTLYREHSNMASSPLIDIYAITAN